MLEKRRQEIINMIFEEATALADIYDSSEIYYIAYSNMDAIKETYGFDELEALYLDTFKQFEELKLREVKKTYFKKIEDYVKEIKLYPNIDMDKIEEYNYYALVAIEDCTNQKDLLPLYLHFVSMFEGLKVTDLHKHYLDMVDEFASGYDISNQGVVLSINLAKNAILNSYKVRELNAIIEEFKSTIGVKYKSLEEVREYYKKQLLEYAKARLTIHNTNSIMTILDETFKVINIFEDANELEVLYGQVILMIEGYSEPVIKDDMKRKL